MPFRSSAAPPAPAAPAPPPWWRRLGHVLLGRPTEGCLRTWQWRWVRRWLGGAWVHLVAAAILNEGRWEPIMDVWLPAGIGPENLGRALGPGVVMMGVQDGREEW